MADSPSEESDESIEAAERFEDQQTGNFGGGKTNVSDPTESRDFGNNRLDTAIKKAVFTSNQQKLADKARRGEIEGVNLQPITQDIQSFREEQENIDVLGYDPTQESIDVGPVDILGLKNKISANLRQGGKPSFNKEGNIIGATEYGPAFGLGPDVTTYTGLNAGDPSGDSTIGGDENDEQDIIRRRMSAETVPIQEEDDPVLSDDLASNYLQNPYYGYSGQGNLYQPYGYANNTLVDLLRTRNMTQPQQRAANLGLFGNPGDFS